MTKVVKVNRRNPNFTVYIGREWAGLPQSKWHNPYHLYSYDNNVELVLKKYEQRIRLHPELWNALPELKDQTLGCWCKPKPCHGDVLARLVEEYFAEQRLREYMDEKKLS